jgi:hypothetical protein
VLYTGNRADINQEIDTRNGAVNGARSDQSNISLDGMPVNDSGGHAFKSVLPVTLDSVQEFRVTTTNYNADQGGSSGAQVALVTKSGTNDFHGSAYEYNRNTSTSANDYFVKAAQLENCNANGTPLSAKQCNQAPKLIRNVFGASVGGPILKDRFYFFLNFEGTRRAEESSAVRTIPTDSLRDGVIQYLCQTLPNGNPDTTTCPGNTVTGVSGKSYTAAPGNQVLGPNDIKTMDPLGLGANSVSMAYFNTFPHPNDGSVGDGFNYAGFRFPSAIKDTKNWYIGKLDYNITRDAKHRLSLSGALANESNPKDQYLPSSPTGSLFDYTKGRHTLLDYSKDMRRIPGSSGQILQSPSACVTHLFPLPGKPLACRLPPVKSQGRPVRNSTLANGSTNATRTCTRAYRRIKIPWSPLNLPVQRTVASRGSTNGIRKTSVPGSLLPGLRSPILA